MIYRGIIACLCLVTAVFAADSVSSGGVEGSWNPKTVAAYLDGRIDWWMHWPGAARDHETFCVSCHTAVAYMLARPSLRAAGSKPSLGESRCLQNVAKRVHLRKEVQPFYGGANAGPSRGTEAVLNALILCNSDHASGQLSDDTRAAFSNMWSSQLTTGNSKGAWEWIQFNNEPWEAQDSQYYGAALAALAVGSAPGNYRSAPEIRIRAEWLREYLGRDFAKQSPANQAVVLWASADWPGLLSPRQRSALIDDLIKKQQPDGGWSLASLVWTWRDWSLKSLAKLYGRSEATPLNPKSDGYATGLITLALERSGISPTEAHLENARAWLVHNQRLDGRWPAYSLNGKRDHSYGEGLFMDDAATAYAVLALTVH